MKATDKISKYLVYADVVRSDTAKRLGLNNTPDGTQLRNIKAAGTLYDAISDHFGVKIPVTSFFRSEAVNKAVGGASSSQHRTGQAMDLDVDGMKGITNADIYAYIRDNLDYDQLIWEFGTDKNPDWVHVSFAGRANRKSILRAKKVQGRTTYIRIK